MLLTPRKRPWRSHKVRRRYLATTALATLALAAPASAEVAHTVQPGETLWSIAAANNLTTRTVAVYNGLSEDAQVVLGSTIMVPTTVEGYAALQEAGLAPPDPAQAPPAPAAAPAPRTPPRRRRRSTCRRPTSRTSPPRTACRPPSPPRSRGRRAASTTGRSPPRT